MQQNNRTIYDVAVIGGGPGGMMAAGRAAELGAKVILLEKNDRLGVKLLLTGGGRCNFTNAELDTKKFLSKFKTDAKFLFSAFSQFGVKETLDFFHVQNVETKVEAEKRAFPKSDDAHTILNALIAYMKKGNVTILPGSPVVGFSKEKKEISAVKLKSGEKISAKSFVLATGGKSHPETGSTGDGFLWLMELGHKIAEQNAALVPVAIGDQWVRRLQGIALPEAKITVFQNNTRQFSRKGKILFTHFGLSGPAILNMSAEIGGLLKYGEVTISLDLAPSLDLGALNAKLQEIFKKNSNKKIKNSLTDILPPSIVPVVIAKSKIKQDTFCNGVTREERVALIKILKDLRMKVAGLLGLKKAIVTSGGVALTEVDFKTMRSRLCPNLYLVGDTLNLDRPSGGYSLQICWTTGYVAGTSAATGKN